MNYLPINITYFNKSNNKDGVFLVYALKNDVKIQGITIKKGCALLSPLPKVPKDCPAIFIYGDFVKTLLHSKLNNSELFCPNILPQIYECIRVLEQKNHSPYDTSVAAYSLLMGILKNARNYAEDSGSFCPIVDAALGIIHEEGEYIYGISDIAHRIGVSSEHLSREFKRYVGKPIGKYIQEKKIDTAKKLLSQRDLSISMVSEICGFADKNYFSKLFKEKTGMTPSLYRSKYLTNRDISGSIWV